MRKSRQLAVATILVLLVIVVGVFSLGIVRKQRLDSSSQELAIAVTEAALTGNVAALLENGSPDFLQARPEQMLVNYTNFIVRTLGPLRTLQSISGASNTPLFILSAELPSASYTLALEFADASANAVVDMLHQDGIWQLTDFTVISGLLVE